ncbi:MAG TPA: ABC transporter substrate-binding protein [Gallionella sp.]|nr:ABC transporter substrate-binding protein [Gallionella sp.]
MKYANFSIARRRFLALLGTGMLWGLLPGCRGKSASPLAVAAHIWPGYEFMFLAQREGWLAASQVTLRETPSASDSMKALADGAVDAAALTLDEVLRARAAGTALSVVLVFDISAGADVVLARPPIRELKQIKGKRIGVEQSALGALMLAKALQAAGLQRDEVRVVPLTFDQHEAAWQRGEVDVLVTFSPVSSRLLDTGAVNLYDSRQLPDTIVDVLAVRQEALERKRDALRHLVAAHLRGRGHLQRNPQDASYRMAAHLGLHPGEVLASYKGIVLPDLAGNRRLLGGPNPVLLASARMLSNIMHKEGLLQQPNRLDGLLYADSLPEAENED